MTNIVSEIASNPKVAGTVSAATTASGVFTWIDWIPNDIGKVATLIGIILSTVLVVYWGQKTFFEIMRNIKELKDSKQDKNDAP